MKKAKIIVSLGIIVIFLVSVITSILAYTYPTQDPINTVSGYCITIISFIVSVFSLIIAMITFFSIDALNSVTSMDNNVLENPDYTIAYSEMFAKFHDCKTQEEFGGKLIEKIDFPKRRTKTCMQYADWLQRIVDHLIWFAYIDFADEKLRGRREAIITKVEKECKRYNSLSNGIQYLLNENVKLIKYVFQYQQAHDFNGNYICNLEDIRGKLLLNPVSQIIYFDYLGLYYRKEASRYLKIIGSNDKEFSAEYMKQVMTYSYTEEQRKLVRVFLNKALENFEKAYQCTEDNILWESYIQYNIVRTQIMQFLMKFPEAKSQKRIYKNLCKSVSTRENVYLLYGDGDSYLGMQLKEEYERSVELKKAFEKIIW